MPEKPEAPPTSDAMAILRKRFVAGDSEMAEMVSEERANAMMSRLVYDLRTRAGLTQAQLAKKIGTKQSVISRLEDADYEGHSLAMLQRIAGAVGHVITISVRPRQGQAPRLSPGRARRQKKSAAPKRPLTAAEIKLLKTIQGKAHAKPGAKATHRSPAAKAGAKVRSSKPTLR